MSTSRILTLIAPAKPTVTCKGPSPIALLLPCGAVTPVHIPYEYKRGNYLLNYPILPSKWPHITDQKLPQAPTDIRGVDHAAYIHAERKKMLKKMPLLVRNKFFQLRFFPYYHFLSLVRKSNVAFTFSNRGGNVLNSKQLSDAFRAYKGPLRKLQWFQSSPHPKDTAVGRHLFRQVVKRGLFEALHSCVPNTPDLVRAVSGVWYFKFDESPFTQEDADMILVDLKKAVSRVHEDKNLQAELLKLLRGFNEDARNGASLIQDASMENCLDAKSVPGYYPKLPFMHQKNVLV